MISPPEPLDDAGAAPEVGEMVTDVELLAAMAREESWALSEFYDRHAGLLNALVFRVLQHAQETEDVLQESFLQIWNKAQSYNPALGHPKSWAITLARNKAIDRFRSRQRRQAVLVEEKEDAPPLADPAALSAREVVQDKETAGLVREALATLPHEQRKPIELAFFGGMTQDEIANFLREPLGTIKARIRRGMMKLREPLADLR